MPNTYFYATRADLAAICEFVLAETDCEVWESNSAPDHALRRFSSGPEVLAAFPPAAPPSHEQGVSLSFWSPRMGGSPFVRRIDFKPGAVRGATHRYTLEGWGLLHLDLAGTSVHGLGRSAFGYNSESRAEAWTDTVGDRLGPVAVWDWDQIAQLSRKLRYHIQRRLAVGKEGATPILPGALEANARGHRFRG